uniref:CRI4 n=1 Tax=Arundo donax TaxID=35708 RepID=A0A0A9E5Q9_ARUDO
MEGRSFPRILTHLHATEAIFLRASSSEGGDRSGSSIAKMSPALISGTAHSTMFPSSNCMSIAFLPLRISRRTTPKL